MPGFTNKGKMRMLEAYLRGVASPTNFYVALVTEATAPNEDINTLGQLTEIAAGNGYTSGGYQLTPGATDFDFLTENDTDNRGEVQIKDIVWTASGGPIPASGAGARYAVLTNDDVTVANREVLGYWDLTDPKSVSDGQPLTLQNCELRILEL